MIETSTVTRKKGSNARAAGAVFALCFRVSKFRSKCRRMGSLDDVFGLSQRPYMILVDSTHSTVERELASIMSSSGPQDPQGQLRNAFLTSYDR